MKLFSKKEQAGSSILKERSQSVIDMFTTAISGLTQIVSETKDQIQQRQVEIDNAITEKTKLEELVKNNEQIIARISNIVQPNSDPSQYARR